VLPQLRELEHEFKDELVVIGVHSAKFPAEKVSANLRAAVLRNRLEHPVVNDGEFAVWQGYGVRAWPTLMFLDPRGYVYAKHEGEFPLDPVRELLREMIAEYDAEGLMDRTQLPVVPIAEPEGVLRFPGKVLADGANGRLFVADSGHDRVVECDLNGAIRRVIGSGEAGLVDGEPGEARFREPQGMAVSPDGRTLYVADRANHALRAVDLGDGRVTTVAGTGERGNARGSGAGRETALASPYDLVFREGVLWIAMAGTHQLWTYEPESRMVRPAAGTGVESIHDGPLAEATFAQPQGIAELDGVLYVADSETSAVRRVSPMEDRVRRLVGRGLFDFGDVDARGDSVRLQHVEGVAAIEEDGEAIVYLADTYNDKIKRLRPATREAETVAGGAGHGLADGDLGTAEFWEPAGVSLDGRRLYVADTNNHAVRVVDLDGGGVRTVEVRGG
jgi:DNA-binding beta-propeller fold protein YncE